MPEQAIDIKAEIAAQRDQRCKAVEQIRELLRPFQGEVREQLCRAAIALLAVED